jgi:hypothetical protein
MKSMSHAALFKTRFLAMGVAALLAGNLMIAIPAASYADDWGDILKPLLKDVLVPGAKLGVQKWAEHQQKKKSEDAPIVQAASETVTVPPETTDGSASLPSTDQPDTSSDEVITIPPSATP